MNTATLYIVMAIAALAIIALLVFLIRPGGRQKKLSKFAALAFVCIIAGIGFGDYRWLGYSFIVLGLAFAVFDIITKYNTKS
jgi:hypothetical protein